MSVARALNSPKKTHTLTQRTKLQLDQEQFLKLLGEFLKLEKHWIPEGEGYSLYLRPTAIALDPFLGLQVPSAAAALDSKRNGKTAAHALFTLS